MNVNHNQSLLATYFLRTPFIVSLIQPCTFNTAISLWVKGSLVNRVHYISVSFLIQPYMCYSGRETKAKELKRISMSRYFHLFTLTVFTLLPKLSNIH